MALPTFRRSAPAVCRGQAFCQLVVLAAWVIAWTVVPCGAAPGGPVAHCAEFGAFEPAVGGRSTNPAEAASLPQDYAENVRLGEVLEVFIIGHLLRALPLEHTVGLPKNTYALVADNNRIRAVSVSGATRVLNSYGPGDATERVLSKAMLRKPRGIAMRGSVIYLTDASQYAVRSFDIAAGADPTVFVFAGKPAERGTVHEADDPRDTSLCWPQKIVVDPVTTDLLLADDCSKVLVRFLGTNDSVRIAVGIPTNSSAPENAAALPHDPRSIQFAGPIGLAAVPGRRIFFVADFHNPNPQHTILRYDATRSHATWLSLHAPGFTDGLSEPMPLAADATGTLYIGTYSAGLVWTVPPTGGALRPIAGFETKYVDHTDNATATDLRHVRALALDPTDGSLWIGNGAFARVHRVQCARPQQVVDCEPESAPFRPLISGSSVGTVAHVDGPVGAGGARTLSPESMTIDEATGRLVFTERSNHRVRYLSAAYLGTLAGGGGGGAIGEDARGFADAVDPLAAFFAQPVTICVAPYRFGYGSFLVTDLYNNRVRRIKAAGQGVDTVAGAHASAQPLRRHLVYRDPRSVQLTSPEGVVRIERDPGGCYLFTHSRNYVVESCVDATKVVVGAIDSKASDTHPEGVGIANVYGLASSADGRRIFITVPHETSGRLYVWFRDHQRVLTISGIGYPTYIGDCVHVFPRVDGPLLLTDRSEGVLWQMSAGLNESVRFAGVPNSGRLLSAATATNVSTTHWVRPMSSVVQTSGTVVVALQDANQIQHRQCNLHARFALSLANVPSGMLRGGACVPRHTLPSYQPTVRVASRTGGSASTETVSMLLLNRDQSKAYTDTGDQIHQADLRLSKPFERVIGSNFAGNKNGSFTGARLQQITAAALDERNASTFCMFIAIASGRVAVATHQRVTTIFETPKSRAGGNSYLRGLVFDKNQSVLYFVVSSPSKLLHRVVVPTGYDPAGPRSAGVFGHAVTEIHFNADLVKSFVVDVAVHPTTGELFMLDMSGPVRVLRTIDFATAAAANASGTATSPLNLTWVANLTHGASGSNGARLVVDGVGNIMATNTVMTPGYLILRADNGYQEPVIGAPNSDRLLAITLSESGDVFAMSRKLEMIRDPCPTGFNAAPFNQSFTAIPSNVTWHIRPPSEASATTTVVAARADRTPTVSVTVSRALAAESSATVRGLSSETTTMSQNLRPPPPDGAESSATVRKSTTRSFAPPGSRQTRSATVVRGARGAVLSSGAGRPPRSANDEALGEVGLDESEAMAVVATAYGSSVVAASLSPTAASKATTAARMLGVVFSCGPEAADDALDADWLMYVYAPPIKAFNAAAGATPDQHDLLAQAAGYLTSTTAFLAFVVGIAGWLQPRARDDAEGAGEESNGSSKDGIPASTASLRAVAAALALSFYAPNVSQLAVSVLLHPASGVAHRVLAVVAGSLSIGATVCVAAALLRATSPCASLAVGRRFRASLAPVLLHGARCDATHAAVKGFFFEDTAAAQCVALLLGALPLATTRDGCSVLGVGVVVVAVAHLAYLLLARPYEEGVEQWSTAAVAGLQATMAIAALAATRADDALPVVGYLYLAVDAAVFIQLALLGANELFVKRTCLRSEPALTTNGAAGSVHEDAGCAPLLAEVPVASTNALHASSGISGRQRSDASDPHNNGPARPAANPLVRR